MNIKVTIKVFAIIPTIVLLASCQASKTNLQDLKQQSNVHKGIFKSNKNQISEICPELHKGQILEFKLAASLPVLFNFHYHRENNTDYPIPERNLTEIKKVFIAPNDNTYCLMWKTHLDNTKISYEYSIK